MVQKKSIVGGSEWGGGVVGALKREERERMQYRVCVYSKPVGPHLMTSIGSVTLKQTDV